MLKASLLEVKDLLNRHHHYALFPHQSLEQGVVYAASSMVVSRTLGFLTFWLVTSPVGVGALPSYTLRTWSL